jgi:hypothetical protein
MRKSMRIVLAMVSLVVIASFSASGSSTAGTKTQGSAEIFQNSSGQTTPEYRNKVEELLDEYKGISQVKKQLKEAGASYQKSLTANTEDLSKHTKGAQQRMLAGVYTFDAGYAALFLQKKEMARFLDARQTLNEKTGFTAPLSPEIKKLLRNPDAIQNFNELTNALDEAANTFLAGITSKEEMDALVDMLYGMGIEGIYIVTESIALADFSPEMLTLMNQQHERIVFLLKLLNIFRGEDELDQPDALNERLTILGIINNYLMVPKYTRMEVEGLRAFIWKERQDILQAEGKEGSVLPFAPYGG